MSYPAWVQARGIWKTASGPLHLAAMPFLLLCTDLIFTTKITGTARSLGRSITVARTLEKIRELLDAAQAEVPAPMTLIVDLNANGVDPVAVISMVKRHPASPRVIAYLSHVQA